MMHVRQTAQAERDLSDILIYLEQNHPPAADRFVAALATKMKALSHFPEIGRARPEFGRGLRSVLVSPYILFYRIEHDEIQILRILHGRRDLKSLFDEVDPSLTRHEGGILVT